MIISRTPFRVTLGGGGTDLPSYYQRFGGFLVSAAVQRYMYIVVNPRFDRSLRVSYSQTEIVEHAEHVDHPIVREALKAVGVESGIEVVSIADLPAGAGLGSSGAFTVGLLNALFAYKRQFPGPRTLAEMAFHIEAEVLGEPVGKQDQFIAAFGGFIAMSVDEDGHVAIEDDVVPPSDLDRLEDNLLYFYTGKQRSASAVLREQQARVRESQDGAVNGMHRIKSIGERCAARLRIGDIDCLGDALAEHWEAKKCVTASVSDPQIDRWYQEALHAGAAGGKIMGAGGGGFFMFYVKKRKNDVIERLSSLGLVPTRMKFERGGSKILVNLQ